MIYLSAFIVILIISATSLVSAYQDYENDVNANDISNGVTVVKVLIYSGDGSMEESVAGIKACIDESNNMNLTPGYYFEYDTTGTINSNTLSSYDVLIMPGGSTETYLNSNNIDADAIKQFVNSGNGYLGICAGAYSASNSIDGLYSGWGLASGVNAKNVNYEGLLSISTTSSGSVLSDESTLNLHHQNGPAMYSTSSDVYSFACYADNKTGYQDYSAIMGENYGSGRVILCGSHPEMDPQDTELLTKMILWSINKS
ncbi:MAG: hypothetical protein A4E25_00796 [Methanobacterium sp. PtaB.Bin024]|nr:MAG: hypothetical protein A4E25_00796 [Methanobacterium sp. PtaB.Bin024]